MSMRNILFLFMVCLFVSSFSLDVSARKRKKEVADTTKSKKEKLSKYDQFFKDRGKAGYKVDGVIGQFVSGRELYYIFPVKLLGAKMLLGSTIESVSDNGEALVGEKPYNPMLICFTLAGDKIQIRQDRSYSSSDDPNIQRAIQNSNVETILMEVPLIAYNNDSTAILFNPKDLLVGEGIQELSAISPYALNSYYGNIIRTGEVVRDQCYFTSARGYEDNISSSITLSYKMNARFWGMFEVYRNKPYTAVMNRTLMLLPQNPMRPRVADPRVGVFPTGKYNYSLSENGVGVNWFANRWRIEPSDSVAYAKGELVEPKKPIMFYIENTFPEEWVKYIRQGILDWNIAFEKIGFKNAVQCQMFPENDPDFDPNNLKYSCVRYAPTVEENSMGPSWVDPRTGEILNASVYVYHDIVSLLNRWRFIQTAAADEDVRMMKLPEDVLGEAIRYVIAHEIGHCLGLMHNMGASAAIPTDSLRSPSFTQKYGTTPSIMDYARYNYVAQPGDKERGVRLTPPVLGVYDEYVIHWMYTPILDAKTPKDEIATLNKWIEEKSGDPMYRYGKQQIYTYDPSSQTESLGDDGIKASSYGIKNLKYIYKNIPNWVKGDVDNHYKSRLTYTINTQYATYISHVLHELGGIYLTEHKEGDQFERFKPVPREKQRRALAFLMEQVRDMDWLNDYALEGLPLSSDYARTMCDFIHRTLWNNRRRNVGLAAEKATGKEVYSLQEYVSDLTGHIFKSTWEKRNLNEQERYLQNIHVSALISASGYELPGGKKSMFGFKDNVSEDCLVDLLKKDRLMMSKYGIHSDDFYALQAHACNLIERGEGILSAEVSGFFFQDWVNFRESNTESIYVGALENVKNWLRQALPLSSGQTKSHYQYLLNLIRLAESDK